MSLHFNPNIKVLEIKDHSTSRHFAIIHYNYYRVSNPNHIRNECEITEKLKLAHLRGPYNPEVGLFRLQNIGLTEHSSKETFV